MTITVRALEWDAVLGGGYGVDCTECGDVWTETTNDTNDLPAQAVHAEAAALLHEDNDHARVVPDDDGQPVVADR